jgi:hypothetical protein
VAPHASAFTLAGGQLAPVPPQLRAAAQDATVKGDQRNRCPGSAEHVAADRSNPYKPSPDYDCDATQRLPGN